MCRETEAGRHKWEVSLGCVGTAYVTQTNNKPRRMPKLAKMYFERLTVHIKRMLWSRFEDF